MSKTWYGHYIETIKGTDYVSFKDYLELDKEIERLNEELEIRDILIKGIDKRIDNHFRKIDRCVFEDTNKLIEIQDLIKKTMGSDK